MSHNTTTTATTIPQQTPVINILDEPSTVWSMGGPQPSTVIPQSGKPATIRQKVKTTPKRQSNVTLGQMHEAFVSGEQSKLKNMDAMREEIKMLDDMLGQPDAPACIQNYRELVIHRDNLRKTVAAGNAPLVDYYLNNSSLLGQYFEEIPSKEIETLYAAPNQNVLDMTRSLYQCYRTRNDKSYSELDYTPDNVTRCPVCQREMSHNTTEALIICESCGVAEEYNGVNSEKTNTKEQTAQSSQSDKPANPYKNMGHLNERLSKKQSKQPTNIPQEHYDAIKEMVARRGLPMDKLEMYPDQMRKILQQLGMNRYYDYIPHIVSRITGRPALIFTPTQERAVKTLFAKVQEPIRAAIAAHPVKRKSFLSYSFVVRKICEILGYTEHMHQYQFLKNVEKLRYSDSVWKSATEACDLPFIPSV
jgi:hypothetical protein